ncbi:Protein CBG21297 [Caenorhabditis briggsae]|uniref:Protein CBG21297 n=1 Tax=Caenorhabditis briggsae TaxID=6238 RepID=A8XZS8_CAEBR|nr:Protein CBG21297 [Caenorhabditis briggsae]CAP38145.2 Protein CBG21297 [Caenorhabditis briggsae]
MDSLPACILRLLDVKRGFTEKDLSRANEENRYRPHEVPFSPHIPDQLRNVKLESPHYPSTPSRKRPQQVDLRGSNQPQEVSPSILISASLDGSIKNGKLDILSAGRALHTAYQSGQYGIPEDVESFLTKHSLDVPLPKLPQSVFTGLTPEAGALLHGYGIVAQLSLNAVQKLLSEQKSTQKISGEQLLGISDAPFAVKLRCNYPDFPPFSFSNACGPNSSHFEFTYILQPTAQLENSFLAQFTTFKMHSRYLKGNEIEELISDNKFAEAEEIDIVHLLKFKNERSLLIKIPSRLCEKNPVDNFVWCSSILTTRIHTTSPVHLATFTSVMHLFEKTRYVTRKQLRENLQTPEATIQVDEASQLPLYALAGLALTFRRARVALVGDVRQLPPFEDADLPKDLADFAISRVLQTAARTGALPVINITVGRRCPPLVTQLYNELFYNQELSSVWSPAKEADLRAFTSALRLNDHFPVQVLDLPSKHTQVGTSLTNIEEAKAAIRIDRTIQTRVGTDDIGILCF